MGQGVTMKWTVDSLLWIPPTPPWCHKGMMGSHFQHGTNYGTPTFGITTIRTTRTTRTIPMRTTHTIRTIRTPTTHIIRIGIRHTVRSLSMMCYTRHRVRLITLCQRISTTSSSPS